MNGDGVVGLAWWLWWMTADLGDAGVDAADSDCRCHDDDGKEVVEASSSFVKGADRACCSQRREVGADAS